MGTDCVVNGPFQACRAQSPVGGLHCRDPATTVLRRGSRQPWDCFHFLPAPQFSGQQPLCYFCAQKATGAALPAQARCVRPHCCPLLHPCPLMLASVSPLFPERPRLFRPRALVPASPSALRTAFPGDVCIARSSLVFSVLVLGLGSGAGAATPRALLPHPAACSPSPHHGLAQPLTVRLPCWNASF